MDIAKRTNVQFGIVEHPAPGVIKTDEDLKKYIDMLRPYPVYIGLQPISLGWSRNFSAELLSQIDYILMDPQRVPMGNGETLYIWQFDTYVKDTNEFMERYMAYTMEILNNEPVTIFGWPLFLPVCIARDYYTLWTEERMQQIISAAKKRNIAIEINDMAHTPHEKFILMAKARGLKFTFGSDARNQIAGRLDYCKTVAAKCNLTRDDFYIPKRIVGKV
jgi:histidinol phosphatase-like PHP family hydrolase